MDTYSLIIIKFVLGMLCLILQINLLGKGNLAPTSAIDQVQNYVLGGIIGGIIYNSDISVLEFITFSVFVKEWPFCICKMDSLWGLLGDSEVEHTGAL